MTTLTTERPVKHHEHSWLRRSDRNVGGWERGARLFLGAASLGASFALGLVWLRVVLGLAGAAGLLTSVAGYCPLNRALGRDSFHHGDLE